MSPEATFGAPLSEQRAREILRNDFGVSGDVDLLTCRINFFDVGFVALVPGSLVIIRMDMLGHVHANQIGCAEIVGSYVSEERRSTRAVRFGKGDATWRLDRVAEADWDLLLIHMETRADEVEELAPDELEEIDPETETEKVQEPARPSINPIDRLLDELAQAEELDPILRRLFHESMAQGQRDRALMAAQSLMALDRAGPLERKHVDEYRSPRLLEASQPFTPELWDQVVAADPGDRGLVAVATALAPAIARMTARPKKAYGLGPRPPEAQKLAFGRIFAYVRQTLGVTEVAYHPQPDQPVGMVLANLEEQGRWLPTLVTGSDLLTGRAEPELAFLIARQLAALRRDHVMRVLVPQLPQQALLVLTAVALAEPDQEIQGDREAVNQQMKHLSAHMSLDDFEVLGQAVRYLIGQNEPFDLIRWNQSVEQATLRAGLILCGDLPVVARILRDEPAEFGPEARLATLIRFAVSTEHQRIRQKLSLAIKE